MFYDFLFGWLPTVPGLLITGCISLLMTLFFVRVIIGLVELFAAIVDAIPFL